MANHFFLFLLLIFGLSSVAPQTCGIASSTFIAQLITCASLEESGVLEQMFVSIPRLTERRCVSNLQFQGNMTYFLVMNIWFKEGSTAQARASVYNFPWLYLRVWWFVWSTGFRHTRLSVQV